MSPIKEALADFHLKYKGFDGDTEEFGEQEEMPPLDAMILVTFGRKYAKQRQEETTNT